MSEYHRYVAGFEPRIITEEILQELGRARAKFPEQDVWVTLAALTEEVGELNQAILHNHFESKKARGYAGVREEAVQVAVMAIRVALDCGQALEVQRPTSSNVQKIGISSR